MKRIEPLVSICCTAYNHEKFLRQCIEGFLSQQTDFPIEIIIHDDASGDGTPQIINEYYTERPDIIVPILQDKNQYSKGKKPLVDYAFKRAQGKYIALCEGDDYWTDKSKLQKQVDFLESNPSFVMCYHDAMIVNEHGKTLKRSKLPDNLKRDFSQQELIQGAMILTLTICFRNLIKAYPSELYKVHNGDKFLTSLLGHYGNGKYMKDIKPAVYRKHSTAVWSKLDEVDQIFQNGNTRAWLFRYYNRVGNKQYRDYFKSDAINHFKIVLGKISVNKSNYYDNTVKCIFSDYTDIIDKEPNINLINSSMKNEKILISANEIIAKKWNSFKGADLLLTKSNPAYQNIYNKNEAATKTSKNEFYNLLDKKGWKYKENRYDPLFEYVKYNRKISSPRISIIVISWRWHQDTLKNFNILEKQRKQQFELIFVDNGGETGEFESLQPHIDTYVRLCENSGAYLARNIGAVFAKAPILLFLEDDGIPEANLIAAHLGLCAEYDIIACRGVYSPKTHNSLNSRQGHYYVGDKEYPTFAHVEGNTSYLAEPFFKVGGWDDDIRFGGGGLELYFRLLTVEPDIRKQIYSPRPIIYHDYAQNEEHLSGKLEKQKESFKRLRKKYPQWDQVHNDYRKLCGRNDLLIKRGSKNDSVSKPKGSSVKRILFVNHSIAPYEASGTPISTWNHCLGMKALGKEVGVLFPSHEVNERFKKETLSGVSVYQVPRLDKYQVFIGDIQGNRLNSYLEWVREVISDFRPDLVHINDYVYMPPEVVRLFHDAGCIVVRNVCNDEELCHWDYPVVGRGLASRLCSGPESAEKCSDCFLARRANDNSAAARQMVHARIKQRRQYIAELYQSAVDGVIFTEANFKEHFAKFIPLSEENTRIIPRGFQFDFDRVVVGRDAGPTVRFAFIGNIMFSKGIDVAFKAFEALSSSEGFELHVYGQMVDAEFEKWINKLRSNYPEKFHYRGVYRKDELAAIARDTDVAIVPSYFDTYNRVVREMLYCGVPVIATDFFGASIIRDGYNGLKVPVGDHRALAHCVERILDHPLLVSRLSEGAIRTPIPCLSDEIEQIEAFYESLAEKRKCAVLKAPDKPLCGKASDPVKAIAFYLPQYHPIPENDSWWGKGFTEWTNVTKARPLFEGHYQPHRPADLGFYDLRVAEVRKAQADMAKAYGIGGFCYYHYWFGGKLLLERPLQEMLKSGAPDFPFCLCWANENWTRTWDGGDQHILIAQNYSEDDDLQHIRYLSSIFRDPRYIRIHDKPLFLVYRANLLPNPMRTAVLWREEAKRLGVGEIYLCRVESFPDEHSDPAAIGFDAAVEFQPDWTLLSEDLRDRRVPDLRAYHYEKVVDRMLAKPLSGYQRFQCVTPSWDNTPRRNSHSLFFTEASPAHYERWLARACSQLGARKAEERLVFINAWNEWGEGNHLEPDEKFGHGYLEATRRSIETAKQHLRKEAIVFHERIRSVTLPKGKLPDTLDRLMELVEFHPDYAPAYLDLGALFKQAGDTQNALAAYEKACSLEPLNTSCLRCLADFYFVELKRNDDAEALYEQIVSLSPEDEEALLMLGNLSTIQRRFEKAHQAFLKVLVRNPAHEFAGKMFDELEAKIKERSIASSPDLLLEEARVLAQRGRSDQAIHTLERLLSAFPDHAAVHNDLGFLLYQTADKEKAVVHYERAVELDPGNPTYRKNLADYYFVEGGELDKAVRLYHEIISANPKDAEALFALGIISETNGAPADAVTFYRMVLSVEPDHASARERLETASRNCVLLDAAAKSSFPASTSLKVSIIIVVFNKLEYTRKCIELAMQHARTVAHEIIVIDNASSDGTHEYLHSLSDTIKLIRNPANVGFTLACNQGARIASGEYILFLNNDTEPAAGWLDHLLALAEADSKIGVVGSKLVFPDGKLQEAGGIIFNDGSGWNYGRHGDPDEPSFDFVREVDYVSGSSLLVRHRLLKQLNYFDERYSPGYYEDTDLCFGTRSLGYKVMYCPFSVVVHHEGISSGTDPKQGMKKYQAINREKFQAKWEMALHNQLPADSKNVVSASERGVSGNILIIDPLLPMFDRASGSLRLFTIVSLLRKQGYHITFIARNGHGLEAYSAVLRKMGVEVYETDPHMLRLMGYTVNARPFDFKQILRTRCYRLAILSFYDIAEQYLPMIRSASPETRILIDTVDIHFVRETRQAELSGDSAALKRADATKERELAIYSEADGVITVTERDWDHIRAHLPSKPHFVIPNIHPAGESSIDLNGRKGLLFIGNFNHTPNTDAMLYFVAEVFPIVQRTLPELTLTIVGNNPPKEVRALARSGILVTGYVPSTEPYLKTARVSIAPLRFGAGMKGKIGEAMAHGLPVVTTSIGAEGMGLVCGRNALIAESPQEFAGHIIALCTNDETWRSIASAARQLVYDTCSPEKVDPMIAGMLKRVALIPPLKGAPLKPGFPAGPTESTTKGLTSIVMLTFNQLKYTKECVQSIQQYTPEPHEIIFIDNGSNDGTVKWLKRLVEQHSNYRLIENDSNLGFSKGCNQGIEASTGDHVVLINNDVVVTKDWLSGLMECLHRAADIGIVGPMTNNISGPQKVPHVDYASVADLHGYASAFRTKNRYRRISNRRVVGFCMLFKRRLIDEIGLLDESFGSGNFEDDDLCLRACLGGYRNLIAGDVFIHHYGSRTFVGNEISYGSSLSRNRKVFQDKWRQPDIVQRFGNRLIIQNGIFHAEEYFRKDDLEKATASILDAIQQAPGERQLYIKLAQMLIEKKRFDDALGILASLPENNSDSRQVALMGYCHEALGNDRSAEDYADQALANLPAPALSLNVKGVLAFKRNDKAAAEAWFRRAIESDPGFGESYTNLGSVKWQAGEPNEALDAFERGFILSPTIDDVATAYHTAVVETKSFERAEAVLCEAQALHPNHKRLAFLMIALLLQQEKVEPAMAEIEKAMLQFGIDDGILCAGLEVRKRIGAWQIDRSKCKRATLSLCMIVKNEEPHLAKCLMSVKPFVDEMIVVDTGSSDRSKDIAAALGARVFDYPWTNDFSDARNYSLAQASGDWILVLDADEVISRLDHDPLRKITRKRPAKHRAYILVTRNYTNNPGSRGWVANEGRYIEEEAGAGWVPSPKVRLFVNDRRIRFVNPVHELVEPTLAKLGIPIRTCDVPVHHYGRLNRAKLMAKGKEYYRLGIAKIEQTQGDCNALRELAIQASEIGEYEEAVGVWQKVIERQPNDAVAHMNLGFAFLMMRQYGNAAEFSKKAMEIDPELREAALNYSAASMFAGDIRTAIATLEHLLERHADYPPAMGRLAAAYIVSGRKADGLRCLEKLNSRGFDCAGACEEQARAFLSESKHEAAALLLAAAIEKGIGNGRLSHLLAECRSGTDGSVRLCEPTHPAGCSRPESEEPVENGAGV